MDFSLLFFTNSASYHSQSHTSRSSAAEDRSPHQQHTQPAICYIGGCALLVRARASAELQPSAADSSQLRLLLLSSLLLFPSAVPLCCSSLLFPSSALCKCSLKFVGNYCRSSSGRIFKHFPFKSPSPKSSMMQIDL